jgi:hypothetical protein
LERGPAGEFGKPGIDDLADQFHGDFGDGIDDPAQALQSEQAFQFVAGVAGGVGLEAVIKDNLGATAGRDAIRFIMIISGRRALPFEEIELAPAIRPNRGGLSSSVGFRLTPKAHAVEIAPPHIPAAGPSSDLWMVPTPTDPRS